MTSARRKRFVKTLACLHVPGRFLNVLQSSNMWYVGCPIEGLVLSRRHLSYHSRLVTDSPAGYHRAQPHGIRMTATRMASTTSNRPPFLQSLRYFTVASETNAVLHINKTYYLALAQSHTATFYSCNLRSLPRPLQCKTNRSSTKTGQKTNEA